MAACSTSHLLMPMHRQNTEGRERQSYLRACLFAQLQNQDFASHGVSQNAGIMLQAEWSFSDTLAGQV